MSTSLRRVLEEHNSIAQASSQINTSEIKLYTPRNVLLIAHIKKLEPDPGLSSAEVPRCSNRTSIKRYPLYS